MKVWVVPSPAPLEHCAVGSRHLNNGQGRTKVDVVVARLAHDVAVTVVDRGSAVVVARAWRLVDPSVQV